MCYISMIICIICNMKNCDLKIILFVQRYSNISTYCNMIFYHVQELQEYLLKLSKLNKVILVEYGITNL